MDGQHDTRGGSLSRPGALLEIFFFTQIVVRLTKSMHCFCDWGRRYNQVRFPAIQKVQANFYQYKLQYCSGQYQKYSDADTELMIVETNFTDTGDCTGYSIGHIPILILSLQLYRQILTDTSDCIG